MDTDDALIRGDLARQLRDREIALAPKWRAATWYDAVACDASRFRVERGAVSDAGVLPGIADLDASPEPRADTHPLRRRDDGGSDGRAADTDAGSDNVPGDADAIAAGDAVRLAGPGADRDRDPALRDAGPEADVQSVGVALWLTNRLWRAVAYRMGLTAAEAMVWAKITQQAVGKRHYVRRIALSVAEARAVLDLLANPQDDYLVMALRYERAMNFRQPGWEGTCS